MIIQLLLNDSESRALGGKHLTVPLYPSRRLTWAQKRSSNLGDRRRFAVMIDDIFSACRNFWSVVAFFSRVLT
jgi:hypothetical protein